MPGVFGHGNHERESRPISWERRLIWLLAGVVILRVVYAAVFPLDLAPDESYYWDWGRRPAFGYYSKPPMIGWLMGLAGWLGNDSMFVLKLFPGLLSTLGLVFVFLLGRDAYGGRAGWWAVLFLLATPANVALSVFFTIDAPLFLCWSASLWLAWRWWSAERGRGWWAAALTASLGCGYLTKQIQLVFPLLLLGAMVVARSRTRDGKWRQGDLAQWGVVTFLSLLALTPPLLWNWHHGWITFRHTAEELTDTPFRWIRSAKFVGEFLGGQAGLGGGMTWLLMMWVLVGTALRWSKAEGRARFLVVMSLPGLLAFLGLSVHQRVEQNWALVFYVAAAVLAAGRLTAPSDRGRSMEPWLRRSVAMGAVFALALLVVPFVLPSSAWSGAKADATARIRGWRELAQAVGDRRAQAPRPSQTFLLAPDDRYVASALAFYLPDHPRTWCWEDPGRIESQYGIWGRPEGLVGWDALVIAGHPESPAVKSAAAAFEGWEPRGEIVIRLGRKPDRDRRYQIYLGRGFRGAKPGAAGVGVTGG